MMASKVSLSLLFHDSLSMASITISYVRILPLAKISSYVKPDPALRILHLVESEAHYSVKSTLPLSGKAHNYSVYAPHSVDNFSKSPLFKYDKSIKICGDCKLTVSQATEFGIYSNPRTDALYGKLMGKKSLHEARYEALQNHSLF